MANETKQLEGGRKWTKSRIVADGWDCEGGDFRILCFKGNKFLLISFIHEPIVEDEGVWAKTFRTLEAAMEYAEGM